MDQEEKSSFWQETVDIIKDIWPKFVFFSVVLLFIVFQKNPTKMKLLGQTEEEIKEQQQSGDYKTLADEELFSEIQKRNLIISGVLILVFFGLRFINERQELRAEIEQRKQAKLKKQQEKEQNKKLKNGQDEKSKQKTKQQDKHKKPDKKLKQQ